MSRPAPIAKAPATYQDLLDAPEGMVAELIDGALHLQLRPASRHALAASSPGDEIVGPSQKGRGGPGGWWILDEPELHLEKSVLVPDVAGWRRVLSPRSREYDLTEKRAAYARAGVSWLWFVDPDAQCTPLRSRGRARQGAPPHAWRRQGKRRATGQPQRTDRGRHPCVKWASQMQE